MPAALVEHGPEKVIVFRTSGEPHPDKANESFGLKLLCKHWLVVLTTVAARVACDAQFCCVAFERERARERERERKRKRKRENEKERERTGEWERESDRERELEAKKGRGE